MADLSASHPSNLLHTQERFARYQPGGYHPVSLGDTFKDGRYEVHHKLGWGGFSTVWLVRDRERQRWVSLKILAADHSHKSPEPENLRRLENHARGSLSSKYIVQLLDTFSHQGPNGIHQCLVFELLGPSVELVMQSYFEPGEGLETDTILRISKQLLEAVMFIHDAGIGHGDISGANIAFNGGLLSHASKDEIFEVLGTPEVDQLSRVDGEPLNKSVPKKLIKSASWMDWIDEDEEDLRVLDFGESFMQGMEHADLAQPGVLRVPETIFTESFDYRVDLWRIGCTIYMIIFGMYPFHYWGNISASIAQIIGFVEELPREWQDVWQRMRLDTIFALQIDDTRTEFKLDKHFHATISDPALTPLLAAMKALLRFRPSDRMEASAALDLLKSYDQHQGKKPVV